jgi:prevent-host-death family protein
VKASLTIKELHAKTGEHVRAAGRSRRPVPVTDRGKLVAVLVSAELLPKKRRSRTLIREYAALLAKSQSGDVLEDLDAIRGER